MPYVGRGLTTGAQYQKLDAIAINNATTFTMSVGSANVSPDQNHLILVVNGVIQEPGTGFTVAGSTCTLASAITTSGHSGTDTIYGVIAGDAAFAAYDSIGANALGVTAGTVTASRAIVPDSNKDIASFRNVTLTGELDAATLDISGNADIDGTTNLDAVDIDGAVQVDNTITVGANDQGYDVKFFGDTASAYMLWDTSADDLVFAGAAGIDLAGDIDVDGTANLDVVDIDGAVDMASTLTLAGNADFNGDLDVDGTTNLDVVDIDGAVDMASTLAVGDAVTINTSNSEQLMFKGATSPYLRFYESTTAKAYIQWHSDGYLNLENSEASKNLAVGANGVGIGTSAPAVALDISSDNSSSVGNTLRITDSDTSMADDQQIGAIEFFSADGGASGSGIVSKIWSQSNSTNPGADLKFDTDGTTRMVIATSTGKVGIGESDPGVTLHIRTDQNAETSMYIQNDTAGTAAKASLRLYSNSALGLITVQDDGYTTSGVYVADAMSVFAASTASGGLVLGTEGDHPVLFYQNNTEKMRIDAVGTIYIKTTEADEKIRLEGSTAPYIRWAESTTNKAYIQWNPSGFFEFNNQESTEYFVLGANGVGINTQTPGQVLDCNSGSGNMIADGYDTHSLAMYKENIENASGYLDKVLACPSQKWNRKPFVSAKEIKEAVLNEFGEDIWNEHFPEDNSHKNKALYNMPEGDLKTWIDDWCESKRVEMRPEDKWQKKQLGLVADAELTAEHLPEVVSINDEGKPTGIDTMTYIGILHNAIQELSAKVTALENA